MNRCIHPKVSVVVPIYGVEKYLHQCVDSILAQTLKDIEIILVDDGSPDRCPEIVDEYAKKDNRIVAVHQPNGGYGKACNHGIRLARGEYIGLVESDDWIEPDMYEKLYNQITKFDADVCIASFYEYKSDSTFPDGSHNKKFMETIDNTDNKKLFSILEHPFLYTVHESVWSKLYKSELIKNIKFSEQKNASYQDGPFITEVFCKTDRLIAVHDFLYHYRVDNPTSSATNLRRDARLMTILDQREIARDILKKYNKYDILKEEFYHQSLKAPFRFYRQINPKLKKEFYNKFVYFVRDLKDDKNYQFKYLTNNKKHFIKSLLKNDFRSTLFDEYYVKKFLGIPIIGNTIRNGTLKKIFLGLPFYVKLKQKDYVIEKYFLGLLKVKKNKKHKKVYLLGLQIFNKNYIRVNNILPDNTFVYYNTFANLLHPVLFEKYRNINKGKKIVLYACGPSSNYYFPIKEAIHVSVNRAIFNYDIKFDTLFMHDSEFVLENLALLKDYDAEKFCAFHTNKGNALKFNTPSKYVDYIGAKRFIVSDPHIKGVDTNIPDVINPDIAKGMFYDRGGGTVFSALQFILYTHPKRIYLVGCDCTSDGYFYSKINNINNKYTNCLDIKNGKNDLLSKSLQLWREAAITIKMLYPDTEIISINPVGLKGLFKDVYTQSYVDEHPELLNENVEILDDERAS